METLLFEVIGIGHFRATETRGKTKGVRCHHLTGFEIYVSYLFFIFIQPAKVFLFDALLYFNRNSNRFVPKYFYSPLQVGTDDGHLSRPTVETVYCLKCVFIITKKASAGPRASLTVPITQTVEPTTKHYVYC